MSQEDDKSLLQQVKQQAPSIPGRVRSVEHLTPEEYQGAQRAGQHKVERSWNNVRIWGHYTLVGVMVSTAAAVVVSLGLLVKAYLSDVLETPQAVAHLLASILEYVGVAGTTLFIDRNFLNQKSKNSNKDE